MSEERKELTITEGFINNKFIINKRFLVLQTCIGTNKKFYNYHSFDSDLSYEEDPDPNKLVDVLIDLK